MEFKRGSVVAALKEADINLMDSPATLGISSLTWPRYMASQRTTMFTNHMKQLLTLLNPEFPLVFTGAENLVGKYSDGYMQADRKWEIVKKVVKFEGLIPNPNTYVLFLYDKKHNLYTVVERTEAVDLTESFGFMYNNDVIDSFAEGETIPKDTILYRSTSYDDDMRYRYGANAVTMYSTEPFTSEDAAIVSKSFAERCESVEVETVTIKLNDNDFLINLHGDGADYKPLPDVGEKCCGIIAAIRTQFNNQLLFDFKADSLRTLHEGDRPVLLHGGDEWKILDIKVYSNDDVMDETPFNLQIRQYLYAQNEYYREIYNTCKWIVESGAEYTQNLDSLFKRSIDELDTSKKWRKGDSTFRDAIDVQIYRPSPLTVGQKITGRYGNKSVIAEVRDDEYMPITEDGRRVDLILNVLAIINRTTAFALFELMITNITSQVIRRMKTLDTLEEQAALMFECIHAFNEEQCFTNKKFYNAQDEAGKREIIEDAMKNGIAILQSPVKETTPIFYRLINIMANWDWIKPDIMYVKDKATGRSVRCMSQMWIGQMYILKLKQSPMRGFSVRSTGAIDNKSLPARSHRSKHHAAQYSDSAIRFGEFETENLAIGVPTEALAFFNALYRTSPEARRDLVAKAFSNDEVFRLPKFYKNRVAQLNNVLFKALGIEFNIVDENKGLYSLDDTIMKPHMMPDGSSLLCTDLEYYRTIKREEIREEVLKEAIILPDEVLDREVERRLSELIPL